MNFSDLLKSKTFWAGITGLVGAASGYFTGALTPAAALSAALGALGLIFLKDGQITGQKKA